MPLKRATRPARKSPLPGKNSTTGRPGFAGTCQMMTFSPSAVVRKCSSASAKPAAWGVVRTVCGIGKMNARYENDERFQHGHVLPEASHPLDDVLGHLLGVAEQHHGVVAVEQGIVDAGI